MRGVGGATTSFFQGVRPAFKFDPKSIIFASEVVSSGALSGQTVADDSNYSQSTSGKNYKLTVLNSNLSMGTVNTDPIDVVSGEKVKVTSQGATSGTKLTYKIVDENHKVVGYGQGTENEVEVLAKDILGNDLTSADFTVYLWAQKDNDIISHEGGEPQQLSMNVKAKAQSLSLDTLTTDTAKEGVKYSKEIKVTYTNGVDPLVYSASGLPAGVTIDSGTGVITGTPQVGTANKSPYTVTVKVTNGTLSDSKSYTLNIQSNPNGGGGGSSGGGSGSGSGGGSGGSSSSGGGSSVTPTPTPPPALPETSLPSASAEAHIQNRGWLSPVKNDKIIGTTGKSLRLEAVRLTLGELKDMSGSIQYRAHVQKDGWQSWVKDGDLAGTTGENKRMEAIQIRLTSELAEKYDVYYRAHVQNIGWLPWVKNGAKAGTTGQSKRMEAIRIVFVKKGETAPQ